MTKAPASSPERSTPATIAAAERPLSSETKGSINLRIEAHTRQLIDDAAAILGKTRTEFMIDSARSLAIDVLLDQRL
uniref:type II toxin-antitoxin system TacA family antitoxin n=1 Tax=Streptomyces turgidiscabies TaxID=85558 RepID=UPI0038F68180